MDLSPSTLSNVTAVTRNVPEENENLQRNLGNEPQEHGSDPQKIENGQDGSNAVAQAAADKHVREPGNGSCHQVIDNKTPHVFHMNCRLQHFCFCKRIECKDCKEVAEFFDHRLHKTNSDRCEPCRFMSEILELHKGKCRITGCNLCMKGPSSLQRDVVDFLPAHPSLDTEPNKVSVIDKALSTIGNDFREGSDYELGGFLGEGGNGQVFAVALQKCGEKKLGGRNNLAVKKAQVSRLEMKVLKELSKVSEYETYFVPHFFILRHEEEVRWKMKTKKFTHLVFMERCDTSLKKYCKSKPGGVLRLEEAVPFFIRIVDGVRWLHGLSIVHRDLKCGNVLLSGDPYVPRLTDFEYAIILKDCPDTESLDPGGTTIFAAPEVRNKQRHDTSADIYSLGILFFEMVIPDATKIGSSRFSEHKTKLTEELKRKDPDLGRLIESCVKDNPRDRPSAEDLLSHESLMKYNRDGRVTLISPSV